MVLRLEGVGEASLLRGGVKVVIQVEVAFSGLLRGKMSLGVGRKPFFGRWRMKVGWKGSGTSRKCGDSGGMLCAVDVEVNARVEVGAVRRASRVRQLRHIERETFSIEAADMTGFSGNGLW